MRTRVPALGGALALVATLVAAPAASAAPTVVASTLTDGPDVALTSYVNDAPAFSSAGDGFGIFSRAASPSIPFSLLDDSLSIFPPDGLGIVDEGETGPFFGATDTVNSDTSGPVTATWTFDVTGADAPLFVNLDIGAMGDFESDDTFTLTATVDGGAATVADVTIDEDDTRDYTLEGGTTFTLDDPANLGDVELDDDFQAASFEVAGTGSELVLTFTAETNGGSEALAFRNVVISSGGPVTPGGEVVAETLTDGPDVALTSYVNDAPAFSSAGDGFGIFSRAASPSIPFSLLDDSLSIFPPDGLGIVDEGETGPFFGATDTVNSDTSGPVTATWTFDVTGADAPLYVNLDIGAMGDFESDDTFTLTATVDGGAATVADVTIDEDGTRDYTLEGGTTFTLDDPANLGDVELDDDFQAASFEVAGTGSELVLTFTAETNGGSEALAFRNVRITSGAPFAGGGGVVEPEPEPECDDTTLTLVSAVQGDGDASPLDGGTVTVRGVVTLAAATLDGFFVQEEDTDADGDPATSEGVFVDADAVDEDALDGATVEVTGVVDEFFGRTQLSATEVAICDVVSGTVSPTPLVLPADAADREPLEGMLVTNAQDLQVSGLFTAYRFGELGLALDGPLAVPTSVFAPDDPAAEELAAANAAATLLVNDRDAAFSQFSPFPWELFDEDLSAGDTMLAGDVLGPLNFSFGDYKVEPIGFFPETVDTDPRAEVPTLADGNDVAAFNVLNYFNTFGNSSALRGARSADDFAVQTAKIVDAINRLDASVLGLIEIENDYGDFYDDDPATVPSVVTLVEALNDDAGFAKWTWVQPAEVQLVDKEVTITEADLAAGAATRGIGTDAIAVGFIYQPDRTSELGEAVTFDIDAELAGDSENNRWPLAQTFLLDDVDVTVVVNHFKSKGSPCTDTAGPGFVLGEDMGTDLLGNCNLVREYAAQQLLDWVDTKPTGATTPDTLVIGDLNAYEEEGPIRIFEDADWVDLVERDGDDAFTFKFDGEYGRLDHALASPSAKRLVTDAEVWQINSRAPVGYQYRNDPIDLTAHGSSDHDPVVVSIDKPGRGPKADTPGRGPKG